MQFYTLESKIEFGKYEGQAISEILTFDQSYIEWCLLNVDSFYIDENIIGEIKLTYPLFFLPPEWNQKIKEKYSNWRERIEGSSDQNFSENISLGIDEINWGYYNENLDMDQQGEEFWNQF